MEIKLLKQQLEHEAKLRTQLEEEFGKKIHVVTDQIQHQHSSTGAEPFGEKVPTRRDSSPDNLTHISEIEESASSVDDLTPAPHKENYSSSGRMFFSLTKKREKSKDKPKDKKSPATDSSTFFRF